MKKAVVFVVALACTFVFGISYVKSQNTLTDNMRNFDYDKTTEFKGLSGYASKKMREYMNGEGSKKIESWAQEAKQKWIEENGVNPALSKTGFNTSLVNGKSTPWEAVPEYRDYLKSQIGAKMQTDFPGMVETYMKDKVFQGAAIGEGIETDIQSIIGNVQTNIMGEMNGILDKSFSDWGAKINNSLGKSGPIDELGFKNLLSQNISDKMGGATKLGLKGFMDDEMFNALGENFGEKLEDMMKQGADALDGLAGQLGKIGADGLPDLSGLAGKIGDAGGLQSMVDQAGGILGESPLGNGFGLNPENYFGMTTSMFNELKVAPPGVNLPRIEIPSPGYAGILAAAAATHFMRAIKFMHVDMNEIRRGIALIKTMVWQLKTKQDSFMLVGGDIGGKGVFGSLTFEMTEERKQKLDEMLASAEALAAQEDGTALRQGAAGVIKMLEEFKKESDGMLSDALSSAGDGGTLALADNPIASDGCADPYGTGACQYTPVDGGASQTGATEEALFADDQSSLDPMRMYSGELELSVTDVKIRGVGLDFELTRSYGSQQERTGDLGYNWNHNYEEKLLISPETKDVLWQIADGRRYWFRFDVKSGTYKSPRGHFKQLAREDNKFVIRDDQQITRVFNEEGLLIEIRDRFANSLKFQYALAGQTLKLARVQDTLGRFVDLRYNKDGLLESVLDPFGREVRYNYDAEQNLVSVRTPVTAEFPEGTLTRYSYSGGSLDPTLNHNITMVMDPKGQIYLKNTYGSEGANKDRLVAQRYGSKTVPEMKVEYEFKKNAKNGMNDVQSITRVIDRKGHKHEYEYNAIGLRLSYRVNGHGIETSKYNAEGQLVEFKDTAEVITTHVYNEKADDPKYRGLILEEAVTGKSGNTILTRYVYDAKHDYRLVAKRRIAGASTREDTFEYNDAGQLAKSTNALGSVEYVYNNKGQMVEEKTGGKLVRYILNGADVARIEQWGDGQTRAIDLSYDSYGNISQVTDPLGNVTKSYFNAHNLLVKQEDALGNTTYFRYDANKNLVETTVENAGGYNVDAIGFTLGEKSDYDELDNLVSRQTQVARDSWVTETYEYDANENLIAKTDWRGIKREYVYDDIDRMIEEKVAGITQNQFVLNEAGLPIVVKNALGDETLYQRDEFQRVKVAIDALKNRSELSYNGFGELVASKFYELASSSAKGQSSEVLREETAYERDAAGRVVIAKVRDLTDSSGQTWWRKYWLYEGADLKEIKDDLGTLVWLEYDGFGELVKQTYADGRTEVLDYNSLGLLVKRKIAGAVAASQSQPISVFEESYAYDALNRPIRKTDAEGNTISREYDSLGNMIALIDELGQKTIYEYDGLARLLREKRQDRVREFLWNTKGELTALKDGMGQTASFSYDNLHRLIAEEGFDGIKTSYTYDMLNRLIAQNVSDRTYAYEYDKLGRMIKKTSSGYVQTFEYDAQGHLVSGVDGNNPHDPSDDITVQYAYNGLNFVESETLLVGGQKYQTQKRLNPRGQTRKMQYPSGEIVDRQYDDSGRLTSVQTQAVTLGQYEYTPLGQVRKEQLGNGIAQVLEYDKLLRLTRQTYTQQDKSLSDWRYGYDKKGRLVASEDALGKTTTVYGYNVYDQMVKVGHANVLSGKTAKNKGLSWDQIWQASQSSRSYEYSLEGEWKNVLAKEPKSQTQTVVTNGKGHRYEKVGDATLAYDAYGNLVAKGDTTYEYDAWNRLIAVKVGEQVKASYNYDAQNRRITKTADSATTTYVYDGWSLLEEYQNQQVTKKYYSGRSFDQYVGFFENNQNYYYHRDRLGSVVAVSDAAGAIVANYDYDEYGKIEADAKSLSVNAVTYTGQYYDAESELYYYKNRYYDAEIGRFLSQDPEGFVDGPNVYAYVNNDPVNFVDPLGKYSIYTPSVPYVYDGTPGVHEQLTLSAAVSVIKNSVDDTHYVSNTKFLNGLVDGVIWNDYGGYSPVKFAKTHNGSLQYWHSMAEYDGKTTNQDVLDKILMQAKEWYENAKCAKKRIQYTESAGYTQWYRDFLVGGDLEYAGEQLGHILHMVQDSYPIGHTKRNENGVEYFEDYGNEDHEAHAMFDTVTDDWRYKKAFSATAQIIEMWNSDADWNTVKTYLEKTVYNLQDPNGLAGRVAPIVQKQTEIDHVYTPPQKNTPSFPERMSRPPSRIGHY